MITKTGNEMVKEALFGAIAGAVRAENLTAEQRRALEQEYGLQAGASLGWRNAGRGMLGGALGAIPGNLVSHIGLLQGKPGLAALGSAGALAGYIYGAKKGTDKYSQGNAERIMARNRKPDVPLDLIA